jgi:hypothetical protein
MSKKQNKKSTKQPPKNTCKQGSVSKKKQDSVFTEAWENMSEDMAKVMPGFLSKGLKGRKRKLWVIVAFTFVELVVLGVVGKFAYDWFIK